MNPQTRPEKDQDLDAAPTLGGLFGSLIRGFFETLRKNKLASVLAALVLVVSTVLAFSLEYDERPRYRQLIFPEIERAENQFIWSMHNAEAATSDDWRLHYFLTAHLKVNEVLRTAKAKWPSTASGRKAHRDFIRYYELIDEDLAIIRTEMSMNDSLDYWSIWKTKELELKPLRDHWNNWLNETPSPQN